MCLALSIMGTKELEQAIIDQVGNILDQAPQDVLRHVLDVIQASAKEGTLSSERLRSELAGLAAIIACSEALYSHGPPRVTFANTVPLNRNNPPLKPNQSVPLLSSSTA